MDYKVRSGYSAVTCDCDNTKFIKTKLFYPCSFVKYSFIKIKWDLAADRIIFYLDELVNEAFSLSMTKRSILKISAKIFHPLGLISPITIQFKFYFK